MEENMKKLLFLILAIFSSISLAKRDNGCQPCKRSGGGVGVQFGPLAFGLGGSSNGPIIGFGPSPDPDIPFSPVIIPGQRCCDEEVVVVEEVEVIDYN